MLTSANRFTLIIVMALGVALTTFAFMLFLVRGAFDPYTSVIYQIVHPICLTIILALRWFYETPLETVQEVARLRNGRWERACKSDDSSQPEQPVGDINLSDYDYYVEAGDSIGAALAQWFFWLWWLFPVIFYLLTIPAALAVAIGIWHCRMTFLGPSHEFARERMIEDREDRLLNV